MEQTVITIECDFIGIAISLFLAIIFPVIMNIIDCYYMFKEREQISIRILSLDNKGLFSFAKRLSSVKTYYFGKIEDMHQTQYIVLTRFLFSIFCRFIVSPIVRLEGMIISIFLHMKKLYLYMLSLKEILIIRHLENRKRHLENSIDKKEMEISLRLWEGWRLEDPDAYQCHDDRQSEKTESIIIVSSFRGFSV